MSFPCVRTLGACALTCLLLVIGCQPAPETGPPPTPSVKVFEVGRQATGQSRRVSGRLQAADVSTLSFGVNGQVIDVIGEVGQMVVAGAVLAKLDPEPLKLRLDDAGTAVSTARAKLDDAQLEFDRLSDLVKESAVSQAEVDASGTRLAAADGDLKKAKTALEQAQIDFGRTQLTAPFAGQIVEVRVERFQEIGAAEPVFVLQGDGALEIEVGVPETFIRDVDHGQIVEARFPSLKDVSVSGVVTSIGAAAGSGTIFPVTVRLSESSADLRPGMTASVTFNFAQYLGDRSAFLIPLSAVAIDAGVARAGGDIPEGRKTQVPIFVLDEAASVVRLKTVEIGDLRGNEIEVFGGLEAGDLVVSAGVAFVRDGMKATRWMSRQEAAQ